MMMILEHNLCNVSHSCAQYNKHHTSCKPDLPDANLAPWRHVGRHLTQWQFYTFEMGFA
jgi:hypothetical protein